LFSVFSPLDWAAPVPAPLAVPVPGLPLDATVPASPPTIPVAVPFLLSTSVPLPGGITGADEVGVGTTLAGVAAGAGAAGGASLRSLQLLNANAATNAMHAGTMPRGVFRLRLMVVSPQ